MNSPLQNILQTLASAAVVGSTGLQLDQLANSLIHLNGCEPAFLGYNDFPNTLCVSINNEVIHGIPDNRKFEEGDVVKLDLGLKQPAAQLTAEGATQKYEFDDGAVTVIVGSTEVGGKVRYAGSAAARKLVIATQEALEAGCAAAKEGNTTHDIAKAIEAVAQKYEVAIIQGYGGHGIGEELHMPPFVPNEVPKIPTAGKNDIVLDKKAKLADSAAVKLTSGMRLAIEPMFATKRGTVLIDKNKWTIKLTGGGVAAHFERTVTV